MGSFLKTERVYTILELNNAIRQLIKSEFPECIWACGEIQDYKASKDRRHIYFNLVQKHSEIDQIIAKVNVAIFENHKPQIFNRLKEIDSSFELKNDIEVKLLCEVNFYPPMGKFSLIVTDIDPIYTLGKIAQSRQKIIEELRKRNLLDKNKLKEMPLLPLRLGLVTAQNSAAYHDFIHELEISGYGFKIAIYNSHMQGERVRKDVTGALQFFNKYPLNELDAIIITRGGGSTADLSWFDDKRIAETIASLKFPVFSALGHHINITITDIVAHTSLKTPTKAAHFFVERVKEFIERLDYLQEEIIKRTEELILERKRCLEGAALRIDAFLPHYFQTHRENLIEKKHIMLNYLEASSAEKRRQLKRYFESLNFLLKNIFTNLHDYIRRSEDRIRLLDPKNILKRGYSVTFKRKRVLKSVDNIKEQDIISTVLYKGSLISQVKEKQECL